MPTANPLPSPASLSRLACLLGLGLALALALAACADDGDGSPADAAEDGRDAAGEDLDAGFLDDAGRDGAAPDALRDGDGRGDAGAGDVPDWRLDSRPDLTADSRDDARGDLACDGAGGEPCGDADADAGPTLPACLADATVCDDGDGCTVDTCDPAPCPDGVPCDGCSHAPLIAAVAPGEPDPPSLLATYEAGPYALVEPFDGLPLATPILDFGAEGGSLYLDGGALLLVDDDLGEAPSVLRVTSADAALSAPGEAGEGHVEVAFRLSAEGIARPVFFDLLGPESAAGDRVVASLLPGLGPPGDYVLAVEQGDFGADRTVALAAEHDYTLSVVVDAGTTSAILRRHGGVDSEPVEVGTVVIGSTPGTWRIDLEVEANARAGQTEPVELLAILGVGSDLTHISGLVGWTLAGADLTLGGVRYGDAAAPGALWLESDGGLAPADGWRAMALAPEREEIGFYLVEDPAGGALGRATLYSELGADEVQALLGVRSASAVVRAEGIGFRGEEDGSYRWAPSLEVCR